MGLLVVDTGLSTTVQDLGRPGYRDLGVPPGGAFDAGAAGLSNALLGNPPGAAVLELTLRGGTFEALGPVALALAGAPMPAVVTRADGRTSAYPLPTSLALDAGDRLTLGTAPTGVRTYLAALGGWETPVVLGSRSTETRLRAADRLACRAGTVAVRHLDAGALPVATDEPFRVIDGPDAARLDPSWLSPERVYRVRNDSDRAGLRLDGPTWPVPADPDRVSTPVAPGAVQAAGGRPLVLGVACGTMGGYPHVAHVISADLDRLAQLRPAAALRFERVGLDDARRLDAEHRARRREFLRKVATAASST